MENRVKQLLESILTEAIDYTPGIVEFLNSNPGATMNSIFIAQGVDPKSGKAISVYQSLKAALASGKVKREKEGKGFKYFIGDGTPVDMPTRPKTPKVAKVPASQKKVEALLTQIESDLRSFRPGGGSGGNIRKDNDSVSKDFRDLGNWINNEEDQYDDDFDESDWEDNDNRIWAPGEYKKYLKIFTEWAKRYSWYKYVDLGLQTSEKDWCEFYITLKKKQVQKPVAKEIKSPTQSTPPKINFSDMSNEEINKNITHLRNLLYFMPSRSSIAQNIPDRLDIYDSYTARIEELNNELKRRAK